VDPCVKEQAWPIRVIGESAIQGLASVEEKKYSVKGIISIKK